MNHDSKRTLFSIAHPVLAAKYYYKRNHVSKSGYTYKPFDDYHCIFVHIPKTAGISISKALFGNRAGRHRTISDYKKIFSYSDFSNYFKFTFTRNPWDRLLSAYNFLLKGGMTKEDKAFSDIYIQPYKNFEHFIEEGLFEEKIINWKHFKPQYKFICEKHSYTPLVDYIGSFENLNNDFDYVKKKLGIDKKVDLPFANNGRSTNYKNQYSKRSRDIVASLYKKDIEIFNYDF